MTNLRSALVAAIAAVCLTTGLAAAGVIGVVDAITKRDVTVAGVTYPVGDGVELFDMANQPIKLSEIHPGTQVELDLDEEGQLTVLHAAVVR